jgi:hypothetical protein
LNFALDEIEARKQLDALKDQYIAVKDLIIAEQDKLIKRLLKGDNSVWGRVKTDPRHRRESTADRHRDLCRTRSLDL